jgi:hypothetical protein
MWPISCKTNELSFDSFPFSGNITKMLPGKEISVMPLANPSDKTAERKLMSRRMW